MSEKRTPKIAHLILAHTDSNHIIRLVKRLLPISDVYLHYDKYSDQKNLEDELKDESGCYFINKRFHCEWGGWNAVAAEIELLKVAIAANKYDRFVFLQGADYPIKSNDSIVKFYSENMDVEFVRGCCCTDSKDSYFYGKCRYILLYNNPNFLKKVFNKIIRVCNLKLRSGYIKDGDNKYPVYWGSAQWALTANCAKYVVDFFDNHKDFNKFFYRSFPADELYFNTVVMNSEYRNNTTYGGPEKEQRGLSNWRNLHYFEYLPGRIKVYTQKDFEFLKNKSELYARKMNTNESTELLDLLDNLV